MAVSVRRLKFYVYAQSHLITLKSDLVATNTKISARHETALIHTLAHNQDFDVTPFFSLRKKKQMK